MTQRTVLLDGQPVVLGGRAFDLLAALTARPGQVCSPQALHQAVWPETPVAPNNLRVQITALRQRLGAQHIDNVARRGYRWVGPVHEARTAPGVALIGRDGELQALQGLTGQHRLVSVVGAGGIGKTCLVRAWRQGLPPLAGGVGAVLVELAPLAQADAVLPAVVQALAPVLAKAGSAAAVITDLPGLVAALSAAVSAAVLAASPAVLTSTAQVPPPPPVPTLPHLVLDNAEHLIDAVAQLAQALLDGVPRCASSSPARCRCVCPANTCCA